MLKSLAREAVHRSGAFSLVKHLNRNQIRILMYHRFPAEHAEGFERQCSYLAKHYKVVALQEVLDRLRSGQSSHNLVALTIDDGYADVYQTAFPILTKYALPATLFVTTGFVEGVCWMPGDYVRTYFASPAAQDVTFRDEVGAVHQFPSQDRSSVAKLTQVLKRVSHQTRSEVLQSLKAALDRQGQSALPAVNRPCTWEQLREMAHGCVSLGAHTVTHPILSRLGNNGDVESEITGSKVALQRQTNLEVTTFAYPNGTAEDFTDVSVSVVRQQFTGAVTAIAGTNDKDADPYQLRRLPCEPSLPLSYFARQLAGPLRLQKAASSSHPLPERN